MDRNGIPFSKTAHGSSTDSQSASSSDDLVNISGKAGALFDAKDPTAPTISKSYVKTNLALDILESRKKLNMESATAVDVKSPASQGASASTNAPALAYRLSTQVLVELLRTARQDPEKYKEAKVVNEKNNISNLCDSEKTTEILRKYVNVPELSIRENEDGSINGHWVDDIHEFNKKRAKNL